MLIRAALFFAGIWAFIALAAGVVMQVELLQPGIQIYREGDVAAPQLHVEFWEIHRIVGTSAWPITALGIVSCFALARQLRASTFYRLTYQTAGVVLLVMTVFYGWVAWRYAQGQPLFELGVSPVPELVVSAICVLAVFASVRGRASRRAFAPWLVFALALTLLSLAGHLYGRQFSDQMLHDTYWSVAVWHGVGGAGALLFLGLLSAVAADLGKPAAGWVSIVLAGAITLSWTAMVLFQARLGLEGMPRGYADYPAAFMEMQVRTSVFAGLALVLFAVAVLRLVLLRRAGPAETPASVF